MSASPAGLTVEAVAAELGDLGAYLEGDGTGRVSDVQQDSRRVQPGDLFVARRGARYDGGQFARDAVERGAVAILAEPAVALPKLAVPVVRVGRIAEALARVAERLHDNPSRALEVVGITGTNGKTTTAWLVQQALAGTGARAARLGTLGYSCDEDRVDETLTTPGADDVARFLARALRDGASHFVMEVSSHALSQHRVDATRFAVAALTNLTQDHLDYHRTMEGYAAAKARLFTELEPGAAVINVCGQFGARLAAAYSGDLIRVGRQPPCEVFPRDVTVDASGLRGTLEVRQTPVRLETGLVGRHNLDNVMVALGVIAALGLDVEAAAAALEGVRGVPGRLERCDTAADDVLVVVDYAHTPDALERALEAVGDLTRGRVWCVFGCGGDRDPAKRPVMGQAVGRAAHRAIITNDNPRSEDPAAIAAAVEAGIAPCGVRYEVLLDRARAIERAVTEAEAGDVVLIAGKGHETYQIIGNERRDFDDRVEAGRALSARRGARG